jgi:hypothetical protein
VATRIIVRAKASEVPSFEYLAEKACQNVWSRGFAKDGYRLLTIGSCEGRDRCLAIVDNGAVDAEDVKGLVYKWTGELL